MSIVEAIPTFNLNNGFFGNITNNTTSSSSTKTTYDDSYIIKYDNSWYNNSMNIFRQFIYYSPLILTIIIVMLGFIFQTLVVLVYLGSIMVFSLIREFYIRSQIDLLKDSFKHQLANQNGKRNEYCEIYDYDKIGTGFVIFYATFTICYVVLPMMFFSIYNFYIFIPLMIYLLFIFVYNTIIDKCVRSSMASFEFFYGLFSAFIVILSLHYTNNDKLLLLSPIQPNSNFCAMPNNQTFKCNVYKNGELVSSS